MNVKTGVLGCLMALLASHVMATVQSDVTTLGERANAQAERITDVEHYLAEINDSLRLARDGEYGRIKREDMSRLESTRDRIADLLEGHASASELSSEDRIALYQAQELISTTLGTNDKNRVVCKRATQLGSRLPVKECLTVAQREELARAARENTDRAQRIVCYAGEGNDCVK